jgi:DNA polymerase-4
LRRTPTAVSCAKSARPPRTSPRRPATRASRCSTACGRSRRSASWCCTSPTAPTPNKLLSKIASDLDKPDGLTVVTADDVPRHIWPLPVKTINGVGPKASAKLMTLGLRTIGQVAACEPSWLMAQFGRSYGNWLWHAAHGLDDRPIVTHSEPVSMSRETTFDRDLHAVRDRAELSAILTGLCEELAHDLQRKGRLGRTIGIKLRFEDFKTVTRDLTLPEPVADAAAIRHAAGQCLNRVDLTRRLRLLGVRAGTLSRPRPPAPEPAPERDPAATAAVLPAEEPELPLFPRDAATHEGR